MAYNRIMWKEVDELLANDAMKPWVGGAGFYSTLSNLIALCWYFILICLLSHRYDTLFIKVIDFFLLIQRMLIHISILLSINSIIFIACLATHTFHCRVLLLGLLQSLGFSLHSLNPDCSFADARVCMLKYIGWYPGPDLLKACWQEGMNPFVLSISFILDYILIFPSLDFISLCTFPF